MKKIISLATAIILASALPGHAATHPTSKSHTATPKAIPTPTKVKLFELKSTAFTNGGRLPAIYTCDGSSTLPPLSWSNLPSGTRSVVIVFDTIPGPPRPGEVNTGNHALFILYNIPPTSLGFTSSSDVKGTFGQNFQGRILGYTPPCSQGPGDKKYTFTGYALSSLLDISPSQATEAAIETAMTGKILSSNTLSVLYARPN